MKKLLTLILLIPTLAFADLGTSIYLATTGAGKSTSAGTVYLNFAAVGFTGTIGNAALSNVTANWPISSAFQGGAGQRLGAVPYVVTSGTLIITEVK